jgi:hypothetical protein
MSTYSTAMVANEVDEQMLAGTVSVSEHLAGTTSRKPVYYLDTSRKGVRRSPKDAVPATGSVPANLPPAEEVEAPFVVVPKPAPVAQSQFNPQQKWEGYVLAVQDDSFLARLVDLTSGEIDEEAEFLLDDVPTSDRDLVDVGAVFYWGIGYLDKVDGQRLRSSSIRFRRLPAWTTEELEAARRKAEELEHFFASQESQP